MNDSELLRPNWVNIIASTVISGLLAWWLWEMGEEDLQKWLLSVLGGLLIDASLIGAMGFSFRYERSGVYLRMIGLASAVIILIASVIYSYHTFSAAGYCIPVVVFALLVFLIYYRILSSRQ